MSDAAAIPAATSQRRRTAGLMAGLLLLLAYQGALVNGYHSFRTVWHYLVHSGLGFGLGLAVAALVVVTTGRRARPVLWALAGQLLSVLPDVMFRFLRMPHTREMDVFLAHITIHVSPLPLIVATVMALAGSWAWWCAVDGRRRPAIALAVGTVLLLAAALAAHTPIPTRLSHFESRFGAQAVLGVQDQRLVAEIR